MHAPGQLDVGQRAIALQFVKNLQIKVVELHWCVFSWKTAYCAVIRGIYMTLKQHLLRYFA